MFDSFRPWTCYQLQIVKQLLKVPTDIGQNDVIITSDPERHVKAGVAA